MIVEDINPNMKIIVVGNGKVGKTTLTIKFAKNIYTTEYKKTLGVDFLNTKRYVKAIDREVEFYIWDTAGQDYYNAITRRYYKGADAALIVFSVIDKESFDNVSSWYDKVINECDHIPIILVMSKIDLIDEAVVSEKEAIELAKQLNLNLIKVSSKNGTMVNEVFEKLAIEHFNHSSGSHGPDSIESVTKNKLSVKGGSKDDDIKEIKEVEKKQKPQESQRGFQINQKTETEKDKEKKKKKGCCN